MEKLLGVVERYSRGMDQAVVEKLKTAAANLADYEKLMRLIENLSGTRCVCTVAADSLLPTILVGIRLEWLHLQGKMRRAHVPEIVPRFCSRLVERHTVYCPVKTEFSPEELEEQLNPLIEVANRVGDNPKTKVSQAMFALGSWFSHVHGNGSRLKLWFTWSTQTRILRQVFHENTDVVVSFINEVAATIDGTGLSSSTIQFPSYVDKEAPLIQRLIVKITGDREEDWIFPLWLGKALVREYAMLSTIEESQERSQRLRTLESLMSDYVRKVDSLFSSRLEVELNDYRGYVSRKYSKRVDGLTDKDLQDSIEEDAAWLIQLADTYFERRQVDKNNT
ncbi:hypothetical protein J7L81_02365 [Candidatus Aerophobetes bacterium]|nr:hypothetical protein [Candidatus Aerophobetes bacterium]